MPLAGSFAALKTQARTQVHQAFAVPVSYYLKGTGLPVALETPLTARLHNKVVVQADPLGATAGYGQISEDVTRVVFSRPLCAAAGISPASGDFVYFPDYNVTAVLDVRDPVNGPIDDKWTASLRNGT